MNYCQKFFIVIFNTTILPLHGSATKCHIVIKKSFGRFLKSHKNN